jgi:hypothetical protein
MRFGVKMSQRGDESTEGQQRKEIRSKSHTKESGINIIYNKYSRSLHLSRLLALLRYAM